MLEHLANRRQNRKQPIVTLAQRQKWAHLDPSLTFGNFWVTPDNQAAIETVKAFLADPLKYSPLIIVGLKGSGKTHLLHAIGNTLAATDPKRRIRCQTAEDFCNHHSRFIRKRRYSDYYRYYFGLNAALTDDIQWVQDDEDAQESLFLRWAR